MIRGRAWGVCFVSRQNSGTFVFSWLVDVYLEQRHQFNRSVEYSDTTQQHTTFSTTQLNIRIYSTHPCGLECLMSRACSANYGFRNRLSSVRTDCQQGNWNFSSCHGNASNCYVDTSYPANTKCSNMQSTLLWVREKTHNLSSFQAKFEK